MPPYPQKRQNLKKKKKSPSKVMWDKKPHEAYLARKAGSCDRTLEAAAAALSSSSSTNQRPDPMATRRIVIPCRRLGTSDSGEERELWQPGFGEVLPQLDGETEDTLKEDEKDEKDEEEKNKDDEEELRSDEDKEETNKEDEEVNVEGGDIFCIHEVKIDTSKCRPECMKCRKNYYKILNSECPHGLTTRKVENCYTCSLQPVDGWIYKT